MPLTDTAIKALCPTDKPQKAQLLEAVLDVLRKDYGVRVVKKPLGKSSTKRSSQA